MTVWHAGRWTNMTPRNAHEETGQERAPSPTPKGMSNLTQREQHHALLVTILIHVVPWVMTVATFGFLVWSVVSMFQGPADLPALAVAGGFAALALFAWVTRIALTGPATPSDPQP